MPRKKIPLEKRRLIREWRGKLPAPEIARRLSISLPTVYKYFKGEDHENQEQLLRGKGYASLSEYQEYLAKKRGHESLSAYNEYLEREMSSISINDNERSEGLHYFITKKLDGIISYEPSYIHSLIKEQILLDNTTEILYEGMLHANPFLQARDIFIITGVVCEANHDKDKTFNPEVLEERLQRGTTGFLCIVTTYEHIKFGVRYCGSRKEYDRFLRATGKQRWQRIEEVFEVPDELLDRITKVCEKYSYWGVSLSNSEYLKSEISQILGLKEEKNGAVMYMKDMRI